MDLYKNEAYSINLMWISAAKMREEQRYLLGAGEADFYNRFVEPIFKWAAANPQIGIDIWVDGELAARGALVRSFEALQNTLSAIPHGTVRCRDVRFLSVVREYPEVFTEQMPLFFRVDLLRAIAADEVLRSKEVRYFVYSDFDVEPLGGAGLFDPRTLSLLEQYGFVLAHDERFCYENSFQILSGEHPHLLASHRYVIIDLNIASVQGAREDEWGQLLGRRLDQEQIFDTYLAMFAHLLDADGRFGAFKPGQNQQIYRYENWSRLRVAEDDFSLVKVRLKELMPTKQVLVPPSHFGLSPY